MYQQIEKRTPNNCKIILTNLKNGDCLCYSLALIKGRVQCNSPQEYLNNNVPDTISVSHSGDCTGPVTKWQVVLSQFKCLVNLQRGSNEIVLRYHDVQYNCVLEFKPRRTAYRVMPVYIICSGHNGRFQAPKSEDNSVQSACRRIAVGAKMIQSLAAEKLLEAGFGRKTFQLENDLNSQAAECTVFHSRLHVEAARKMKPAELWEFFGRELMSSSLGSVDRKFLAFLSCTRYVACEERPVSHERMLLQLEAHVALGGGGLAIFGTACLYTWPQELREILRRFLDTTVVDSRHFMDDSCYRGTYGGCFATTLGSVCHELGHTFDLGHTETGIMGRGFDNLHLVFTLQARRNDNENAQGDCCRDVGRRKKKDIHHTTVQFTKVLNVSYCESSRTEPRGRDGGEGKTGRPAQMCRQEAVSARSKESDECDLLESDMTYWAASCATLLAFHRWFNTEVPQNGSAKISFDETRNVVVSGAGLVAVELRDDSGLVLCSWQFPLASRTTTFRILAPVPAPVCLLVAQDCIGHVFKKNMCSSPPGHSPA